MSLESIVKLTCVGIPDLRCFVERPCANFISVRVIERHCVDYVLMVFKREHLFSGHGIENFAGSVIRARDELVTRFVEGTVCQWQKMRSENFK